MVHGSRFMVNEWYSMEYKKSTYKKKTSASKGKIGGRLTLPCGRQAKH